MSRISLARVYDREPHKPGSVFLVERLWPRGVRKDALELDGWLRDVAPSHELRKWFSHDPARWEEFRRRYFAELDGHPQSWQPLVHSAESGDVTLLYSSHDQEHNNAVALREYLQSHLQETEGRRMQKLSLEALAHEHLERARGAGSGRSAETVYGGHEATLRQTLMALTAGTTLAEHETPGEATVHVLSGRVRLSAGDVSWEGRAGDLLIVPPQRHDLAALEDAAVLLTVAIRH